MKLLKGKRVQTNPTNRWPLSIYQVYVSCENRIRMRWKSLVIVCWIDMSYSLSSLCFLVLCSTKRMADRNRFGVRCQKSLQTTRLETRTKEYTKHASMRVKNLYAQWKWLLRNLHQRPTFLRFECERVCSDPKDGELYLSRVKPGETLVEARSDTDVQIVRQTWV